MSDDYEELDVVATALAVGLPSGAIPIHAYVIIEYENPGSDDSPELPRVAHRFDVGFSLWSRIGLLQFVLQQELNAVALTVDTDTDDE